MKLQDILKVCKEFIDSPEDEQTLSAYNTMLQELKVRAYLPMQEKVIALVRMIIDSDKDFDVPAAFFTAGLEIACLFDGLLSYVNIEPEVNLEIKNYENYDILYQSGFADYVLEFCEKDYDRLVRLLERTLSYENLAELIKSMQELDTGALKNSVSELKASLKEANPEMIKDMADIMRLNDPTLNELKVAIVDKGMEEGVVTDTVKAI
uniref:Uncharacterized protein n=1 Tax=Siphoviridae sp. ctEw721 TaxID=2825400 RepID=A0A8S5TRZ2_9CAUD|nr:MAG TPA: hypothetical protein [Siphoviridae sp. ctEw721]